MKREDIERIRSSGLFDGEWYMRQYPDVKALGMDPVEHYVWIGARLGRNPGPNFNSKAYIEFHKEAAGANALLHVKAIAKEHPLPNPFLRNAAIRGYAAKPRPIIIYESHNFKLQGAPNSLFEIAKGIARRKKFFPVVMSAVDGPLGDVCRHQEISVATHGVSASFLNRNGRSFESYIDKLSSVYRKANAALVHVNTLQNFHCVHAASQAGLPVIWNIRESEEPDTYYDDLNRKLREFAYSAFARATHVVFVAETTRELWRKRLDGVVSHSKITNGIDTSRLMSFVYGTSRPIVREALGIKSDDVLVLNVGTVAPRKGQEDLVEAVGDLDNKIRHKVVAAFVGMNDGDYSRRLRGKLEKLRKSGFRIITIEESVKESERQKVAELYLAADLFVLCSRLESYPRVILEAMAFGLPIISTPCFGVREQLVEGESGIFYPAGDVATLARHLSRLCADSESRERLARNARARLSALNSYEKMIDAYEFAYERLLTDGSFVS